MIVGLVVAVAVALLFSTYVYRTMQRTTSVKPPEMRKIVVAQHAMPLGTRLGEDNIRVISWPGDEPIPGAFTRIEDCVGRALITQVTENEPILEGKLAPKEAGGGLPSTIPEGKRALSVAVNDVIGVAGFVIPGTMVDVLVTGQEAGGGSNITKTILEDVPVLAAGQKIEQDRDGKPQTVPVITVLVTPEDAAKLTMASTEGRIQMALRNTIDSKTVSPPSVLQSVLFSGGAPLVRSTGRGPAPKRPPSPYVVEVITGTKKESKSFENQ